MEPGNSAVVDLVYDLEDEIAAQPRGRAGGGGASGATAARQKGGAKAGGESSKGSEEGGEQEGPQGPSEAEISFAFGGESAAVPLPAGFRHFTDQVTLPPPSRI